MSFVKLIEQLDAKYGIPRPAEYQHLTAFHAFLRICQHGFLILVLAGCGGLSAYLLWLSAGYLRADSQTRLYFIVGMVLVICVALSEAGHEVIPYYRIKQRLTYGTARWADEIYLRNHRLALKLGQKGEELQPGSMRIAKLRRGFYLVLNEIEWLRHIVIFGPPGSGKSTTFLMNMLRDLSLGASAIILDPKGELYEQTAHYFNDVYRLDLLNPECSDRWNFVPDCKDDSEFASQMAATMIGLEGTKHSVADPFWQESELLLLTALLLHLPHQVAEPTPSMIYEYLGMRDLKVIDGEMSNSASADVRLAWGAFRNAPPQTQGSVITGLMNKLQAFEIKNAQAVCAPISHAERRAGVRQVDFRKLRKRGTAVFVVVAEGDATRYKNVLSTFFGQAVNQLRLDKKEKDPAPVCFCLDEAANVPIVGLKEIAGVGRGRRIGLVLGYQNVPQVQDQYGHDGANAILGSIGTTIFLPGLDDATSQYASRRVGQTTSWSRTTIDAHGKMLDSERQSETGRALMDPTELRQMVKHSQCVVIIDTVPPIKASYPPLALRPQRAVPDNYGPPRLVSLLEAEEHAQVARAAGMVGELTKIVQEGEAAAGLAIEEVPVSGGYRLGGNGTGMMADDSVYKIMFDRLVRKLLPEDCEASKQTPLALFVKTLFDNGQLTAWEQIKELDLRSRAHIIAGKKSIPVGAVLAGGDGAALSSGPIDISAVGGLSNQPETITEAVVSDGGKQNNGSFVFYTNDAVANEFVKAAGEVVTNAEPFARPVPSTSFMNKAALLTGRQQGAAVAELG